MSDRLLHAHDTELRGHAEVRSALRVERLGPLHLAVFPGGFGLVTYRDLAPLDESERAALIRQALDRMRQHRSISVVEWKTRAHDDLPGLDGALRAAGFVPGRPESIMIGEARLLARDVPLPTDVVVRSIRDPGDVRRASAMADLVFGETVPEGRVDGLLARIEGGSELWVAERGGEIVSTGRLEPVPGTGFAGIWGGATREDQRHRGIYRALTAARARSAIAKGFRWITSDSTECSRPILERSGLIRVSATTPYEWRR